MHTSMGIMKVLCFLIAISQALEQGAKASSINRVETYLDRPEKINPACVCGTINKARKSARLIGGVAASPNNKYPFMAIIRSNGKLLCPGTLISDQFVLTAASCVKDSKAIETTVQLGVNSNTAASTSSFTSVGVNRFIIHGSFNKTKKISPFDLALLRLANPVPIKGNINPICMPISSDTEFTNDGLSRLTISWADNSTASTTSTSGVVQELTATAISTYNCQGTSYNASIVKEMLCVKNSTGGSGLEARDYGAPFMDTRQNSYVQLGLAFHQSGDKLPGIYTYLRTFVKWIYGKTTHSKFCKNPIAGY